MVLRSIGVAALAFFCAGCATVSMKPANLTASFSKPKSDLEKTAVAYCDVAQENGWVQSASAMDLLQRTLFPGADDGAKEPEAEYFQTIQAETGAITEIEQRLVTDIADAHKRLTDLNTLAGAFLAEKVVIARSDVSEFEEALIAARKSHRSFEVAQGILEKRNVSAKSSSDALRQFDDEIQRSKSIADRLVSAWQDETAITS